MSPAAVEATVLPLRERKKSLTREALAQASVEIIREQGPQALTAEAIADRVGVSRRTFFNYFPNIDAAVAHSARGLLEELTEALDARPAEESIWETIPLILTGPMGSALLERIALLSATRERSPQSRHLAQDHLEQFVDWLAEWLTVRMGMQADPLYAVLLASTVTATMEGTLQVWHRQNDGQITEASLADYRDLQHRALELLRTGFDRPL